MVRSLLTGCRPCRSGAAAATLAAACALALLSPACTSGTSGSTPPVEQAAPEGAGTGPTTPDLGPPGAADASGPAAAGAAATTALDLLLALPSSPSGPLSGPRMAEVILHHGTGLRFASAATGEAALAAGKEVVAQTRPGERVRIVVFSSGNLTTLGPGVLAHLFFARTGSGPAAVEVLHAESAFAPAELEPRPETLSLQPAEEVAR